MRKLILIIMLLLLCNFLAFRYLLQIISNKKPFTFCLNSEPLLLQKKDIVLKDKEDFRFNDFFMVLSFSNAEYLSDFKDDYLEIVINEKRHQYPYRIEENITETIETIIYREIYIEKPADAAKEDKTDETADHDEYEHEFFDLLGSVLSFPSETDISDIIKECRNLIHTNMQVSIDYSALNPNHIGQYPVYFYTKSEEYRITVDIF